MKKTINDASQPKNFKRTKASSSKKSCVKISYANHILVANLTKI